MMRVKEYTSPSGLQILVGQDDASNDRLTLKEAQANDLWFHVSGFPGSHVILRCAHLKNGVPKEDIRAAAQLAAYHSKMRDAGKVQVHYCFAKDVHKPRGAKPGSVQIRNFKAIKVFPKEG